MRIAIVAGVCVEKDAVSAAVAAEGALATTLDGVTAVDIFAEHVDRPLACPAHVVADSWELLTHAVFKRADVAVFHFGIRYPLFDALVSLESVGSRPVVHFHNVTPSELVPAEDRASITRSIRQLQGVMPADPEFWYFSEFNRRTLVAWGVEPARMRFVPFPIEPPRPLRPRADRSRLSLLSVGRFVPAKRTHVILEAVALARRSIPRPVQLTLAGNPAFSHPDYMAELESLVRRRRLDDVVTIVPGLGEEALWRCYESADVVVSASLHEGLCVPIVEGYLAGCRAIGTTAANLPFVVQPPDIVVEPDHPEALAAAIVEVDRELVADEAPRPDRARAECLRYGRGAAARALQRALAGPVGGDGG